MKKTYQQPSCEIILVEQENIMQETSRFSEVSSPTSVNSQYEHHSDPNGSISGYSGGESLSKRNHNWESVGAWE